MGKTLSLPSHGAIKCSGALSMGRLSGLIRLVKKALKLP